MNNLEESKRIHVLNEESEEVKVIDEKDKIEVDDATNQIKIVKNKSKEEKSSYTTKNQKIVDTDIEEQEIEDLQITDEGRAEKVDLTDIEIIVKDIVFAEFSRLIDTIEDDFAVNYNKKKYNFLLSQLDELVTATMVFVSSFESKSGFAIERVAERVARIRYGNENVPSIINPNGIEHNINPDSVDGQIIITNINLEDGALKGAISQFRASNVARGRGKNRVESGVTQDSIKTLLPIGQNHLTNNVYIKPVDLAFFDGENWNLLELKAGGDLDSSNAPSNIEKLLSIYVGVNVENVKLYFATLYNKDGEGNTWTGAVKKHMAYPEMFLIGKNLWNKILPQEISYERFTELYKIALEEIDLNERIRAMIRQAIEQ